MLGARWWVGGVPDSDGLLGGVEGRHVEADEADDEAADEGHDDASPVGSGPAQHECELACLDVSGRGAEAVFPGGPNRTWPRAA